MGTGARCEGWRARRGSRRVQLANNRAIASSSPMTVTPRRCRNASR